MENVTDRTTNPFDMRPPCDRFVPGYGDANAHFHVVGDHPGVHGGGEARDDGPEPGAGSGVPFTNAAGLRLQRALRDGELLRTVGEEPTVERTFLSYLHMCVPDGEPTAAAYDDLERYFDAELRAIAAHVLLPVGERATRHVLANYTARPADADLDGLWFTELRGGGWLVVPVPDPEEWDDGDHDRLVATLRELQRTDYRRESDLGRFLAGEGSYYVR